MDLANWIARRYELTHRLGNWAARGLELALEGITAETAEWRPTRDQHTIAEIVAHVAYHKELVVRGLRDRPWEYRQEDDWQAEAGARNGWAAVRARLDSAHQELTAALRELTSRQLLEPLDRSVALARTRHALDRPGRRLRHP